MPSPLARARVLALLVVLAAPGCSGGGSSASPIDGPPGSRSLFVDGCPRPGFAHARTIDRPDLGAWGPGALGAEGDVVLGNDRAAFVITAPDDDDAYYYYGGIVVDAVAVDGCRQSGPERFASLGGAIAARDDDLARYQVRQIAEILERDMVLATPPRPLYGMDLEPLRTGFRDGPWRALQNAVDNHDLGAAVTTFEGAAAACNECHRTTGVPFLTVPGLPAAPKASGKTRKPATKTSAQPAPSAPATTKSKVESTPAR